MLENKSPQGKHPKKGSAEPKKSKATSLKPKKGKALHSRSERKISQRKLPSHCMEDGLAEDIQAAIAQRAHELYEYRGRVHGYDWEDWLKAEQEILGESPRW